ncbi:MAG: hypothetical protein K2Z81_02860 [Cyanobacteria bacterium]|nr:hypothetical protein [Cyanobacteriota bacterium]
MFISEISESQIGALELLCAISDDEFKVLVGKLEEAPLVYDPDDLVQEIYIEDEIESSDIEEFSELIYLLVNIYIYCYRGSLVQEAVVTAFIETFISLCEEADDINLEQLTDRVVQLLEAGTALKLCAYAVLAIERRDKVVTSIGISSNVEPIFTGDEDDEPAAGLINNIMSIGFLEDGEERVINLCIDQGTIEVLMEQLQQLNERNEKLVSRLSLSEMPAVVV